MRSACLRYFNAAGVHPDGHLGEDHDPETHLIPLVLDVAAGKRSHIEIFGENYPTSDGTCIRDYIRATVCGRTLDGTRASPIWRRSSAMPGIGIAAIRRVMPVR
jgi:hypothetical protein